VDKKVVQKNVLLASESFGVARALNSHYKSSKAGNIIQGFGIGISGGLL
jgi:hypothetical protein